MIPWIQVYSNLIKHPKTYALADELKITCAAASPNAVAAGMMVSLWLWAAQNATDGDLSKCSVRAIAEAAEYRKSPSIFVTALKEVGWLDADMKLHDWDEYATLLVDYNERQREKTKERVRRHREKKKAARNDAADECNGERNVTDTPRNASTLPNLTLPNLISGGDGAVSARAKEASDADMERIGLKPGEYLGVTVAVVDQVCIAGHDIFARYVPTALHGALDCRKIFQHTVRIDGEGGGMYVDPVAVGLLEYAFEVAWQAGKPGNWSYIDGVLNRCSARGILSAQMAREWDEDRPDLFGEVTA